MSPIRPANLFLSCICSNSTNKKQYLCYKIAETRQHYSSLTMTRKEQVISFLWQHVLLIFSLYLMTFGVVLCIKSALGSSVISSLPLSFSMAGASGLMPTLSVGGYTIVMNFVLVGLQILILGSRFKLIQLFQLIVGFLFGWLIDINFYLMSWLDCQDILLQMISQFAGCLVMALGIAFEVKCGSVTMPGEGITVALSQVTKMPFAKMKIIVDTTLVVLAVISSFTFFGCLEWNIIGPGTLFAMFFVGYVIKLINPHLGWFDRLIAYRPGFRRYIFGLARYIYGKKNVN